MGEETYKAVNKWICHIKGGLLIATIAACTAMGFASGSSLANAAMFTRLALPEMRKHGYSVSISAGAIAAAGTLAALIPPSGMMVIFCVLTGSSLGKLMIAGIVPGILVGCALIVTVKLIIWIKPELVPPKTTKVPFRERLIASIWIGPVIIVILSILGGLYMGVFTPTEAGGMGAAVTFVYFIIRRGFDTRKILESLLDTAKISSALFIIIIGAMVFSRFLSVSGSVDIFSSFILNLPIGRLYILILVMVIYLILGTFMEAVAIMSITLPIFYPILTHLGFDGTFLGVLVVMMVEIGVLTPPLGTNVFVVKSAAGSMVTLEQVYRGVMPFVIAYLIMVAIIIAFPRIVLFLPELMR
jgi:tripartite ATP-independent transporter DctM subunit